MADFLKDLFHKKNTYAFSSSLDDFEDSVDSKFTDTLFISSSGTTSGNKKIYALPYQSLKNSASSVNDYLKSIDKPNWLSPLPFNHIGGISTYIRASLKNGKAYQLPRWDLKIFIESIERNSIHYTSIVPTIAYDIVKNKIKSPPNLLAIFVGGDHLDFVLKKELLKLGWPVHITYGMTECASQLATSKANFEEDQMLKILPHHHLKMKEGHLYIKSESLFSHLFILNQDQKIQESHSPTLEDGFWKTNDRALIKETYILPLGRIDDTVKIKGHLFSLKDLKLSISKKFNLLIGIDFHLELEKDLRDGYCLYLFSSESKRLEIQQFILASTPIQYLKALSMNKIERTSLGKIKKIGL